MRIRARFATNLGGAAIAAVAAATLLLGSAAYAAQIRLLETGSSLLYPLFNLWIPASQNANPDVQITTQSTGSGTGISEAISAKNQGFMRVS